MYDKDIILQACEAVQLMCHPSGSVYQAICLTARSYFAPDVKEDEKYGVLNTVSPNVHVMYVGPIGVVLVIHKGFISKLFSGNSHSD